MTKLPILKCHVLCMLVQLQFSFKHNAKKHLIFAAIFLTSFVSWERLILYMQLIKNFKCLQPPISLGTVQQRQHSILFVFWWQGSYWLQLYNKTPCHSLKSNLCSKFIRQILGGITLVVYFVQVKQIFPSLSLALVLYVFRIC